MAEKPNTTSERAKRFVWEDGDLTITPPPTLDPAPNMEGPIDATRPATWPEFIYRLIEHYKWEPQLLKGPIEDFNERVRRQEVPLNFLFNIVLRGLSPEAIRFVMNPFYPLDDMRLVMEQPWSPPFTQPDVRLESGTCRIFIELKVDAPVKLEQVQRYLLLHAEMDVQFKKVKKPYLFFLTPNEFSRCWTPRATIENLQSFLKEATRRPLSQSLSSRVTATTLERYHQVWGEVGYGAATWGQIGDRLRSIPHAVENWLIDDFLNDLNRRGLLTKRESENA